MFKNIFKKIKYLFIKEINRPPFIFEVKIPNKRTIRIFKFYIPKFIFSYENDLSKDEREINNQTIRDMVQMLGTNRTIETFKSKRFMYRLLKENHIHVKRYRWIRGLIEYPQNLPYAILSSFTCKEKAIDDYYIEIKNYINRVCK